MLKNNGIYEMQLQHDEELSGKLTVHIRDNRITAENCDDNSRCYFIKRKQTETEDFVLRGLCLPYTVTSFAQLTKELDSNGNIILQNPELNNYYVYEFFDCDVEALLKKDFWKKISPAEQQVITERIVLIMLLNLRDFYCHDLRNLDIKPPNILCKKLDEAPHNIVVKMTDLDTVHHGRYTSDNLQITGSGTLQLCNSESIVFPPYTPGWGAPACIAINKDRNNISDTMADCANFCDLYSLGLLLYWLYSNGDRLFRDDGSEIDDNYSNRWTELYAPKHPATLDEDNHSFVAIKLKKSQLYSANKDIAYLIYDMLRPYRSEGEEVNLCDEFLKRYCSIIKSIPPDINVPRQYINNGCYDIFTLELISTTKDAAAEQSFSCPNYQFYSRAENAVHSIAFTTHRTAPRKNNKYRKEYTDVLFLSVCSGNIYYWINSATHDNLTILCNGEKAVWGVMIEDETVIKIEDGDYQLEIMIKSNSEVIQ